jgi:TonB family protein
MIKVSLLLLLGLAADTALRKRSAALRHALLAAAIVCAALTPVLELPVFEPIVPQWQVPLHASWFGRRGEPLTLLIPVRVTEQLEESAPAHTTRSSPVQPVMAGNILESIWMAGVGISFSILFVGLGRLGWLASRSQRVSHGTWTALTEAVSHAYGLGRPVLLLQSEHPTLLVTWGLRQPKVILPREARCWSEDRVRIVLAHELAHIYRRDWLIQMVAEVLRSVYWFNPLVWIACRRLRQESEHACDDAVLSLGVEGPAYATHLLDLARTFKQYRTTVFPAPAMARISSLERRISAMLNPGLDRTPITRPAGLAVVIALLTATMWVSGLVVSGQTTTATFSGSLVDAVGRILPDVTLVLSNLDNQARYESRSDQTAHFTFSGIPAGEYQLEVRKVGFATSQGRMTLVAGQNLNRDVAVQVGGIEETLNIVSSSDTSAWPPPPPPPPPPPSPPGPSPSTAFGAIGGTSRVQPPPPPPPPPAPQRASVGQPDFDACSQSPVGGCILQPVKVRDSKPHYPQRQRDAGVSGKVVVEGRIGTDGFIKDLRFAAQADPDFATATVDALRQWQFTATRLDGVPVETNIRVTANFLAQ